MAWKDVYDKVIEVYYGLPEGANEHPAAQMAEYVSTLNKIETLSDAEKERLFKIALRKNPDLYNFYKEAGADKVLAKDLYKNKQGDYTDEVLANALGMEAKDLYDPEKGWMSVNGSILKDKLTNAGYPFNATLKLLEGRQTQKDRKDITSGDDLSWYKKPVLWAGKIAAPRQFEAIEAGKDPSGKDIGLDVTENILQGLPLGRAALGLKALGQGAVRDAVKYGAEYLLGNAAVPAITEAADANFYDQEENPDRSEFSPRDVLVGTTVNSVAPYMIGMPIGAAARRFGKSGLGKRIQDVFGSDPVLDADALKSSILRELPANSPEQWQKLADISVLSNLLKDMNDGSLIAAIKNYRLSRAQVKKYKDALKALGETNPEVVNRQDIKDAIDLLDTYDSELKGQIAKGFEEVGPGEILPTQKLGKNAKNYAVKTDNPDDPLESGKIVYYDIRTPTYKMNKDKGIPIPLTADASHRLDVLAETAKAGHSSPTYPVRPSAGDKIIKNMMKDEDLVKAARYNKWYSGLGSQAGLGYTSNKLGKSEWGEKLVPGDKDTQSKEAKIKQYLNDEGLKRMWIQGKFVPAKIPGDPMYEAWKIIMKEKE